EQPLFTAVTDDAGEADPGHTRSEQGVRNCGETLGSDDAANEFQRISNGCRERTRKTKNPRVHGSKRGGDESVKLWRLYPERSITPHRICGSGRLLPGLELETQRAESSMSDLA